MKSAFELLHPGIQRALWDMRWSELRPLQVNSIRSFHESDSPLILSASTASGKTEAAFLPLLSAIADEPEGSVRALYVGPLKALINDQFQRLADLCHHVDIPVHRWHGDVSATDKQRFRKNPGGVLLITPESLESAFINYGSQIQRIFARLDYVVIDELHSFVADVRGVHLRSLLARLAQAIGSSPRILGLSATLSDFDTTRRFLDNDQPDRVTIIEDKDASRSLRIGLRAYPRPVPRPDQKDETSRPQVATHSLEAARDLLALATGASFPERPSPPAGEEELDSLRNLALDVAEVFQKDSNLIFTNSRGLAEMLADELNQIAKKERWPRNPFVLHHGSLSKEVREEVEERLKKGEPLSAFCTSTLEMGIDIGSVHSVGQLGPPWSVASLVQRVGRSGRREGESSILRLYSLDPPPTPKSKIDDLLCPQLLRSIALTELMLSKWLEPFDSDPHHFSTLVHQILSLLRQTGGCSAKKIYQGLIINGAFRSITSTQLSIILRNLAARDLIEQVPSGDLILSPDGETITHGRDFYAAFAGGTDYLIRHREHTIGMLPQGSIPPEQEHFLLNGKRWQVEEVDHRSLTVEVTPARSRNRPLFMGSGGSIHRAIIEKMRDVLACQVTPQYLHPDAAALLNAARVYAKKLGLLERPWLEDTGTCIVFPWTGTKGMQTLRLCAAMDGIPVDLRQLSITYHGPPDVLEQHLKKVSAKDFDAIALAELMAERFKDKFDEFLPEEILNFSNSVRGISLDDASAASAKILDLMN